MRTFLKTSLAFTAGLLCVLLVTDRFLGWRLDRVHGKACVAPEVYVSLRDANDPSAAVRTIYLGDSVAHQLFPPGREPGPEARFLACNQAISVAGQYYLLKDALAHCPNVRDAYLLYYPGSFENALGPPLSNDYFCGFFHSPAQIREVFGATHDVRLLTAQVGRFLLPHVMEANSLNRPMVVWTNRPGSGGDNGGGGGLGPEPLLTLLDKFTGGARLPAPPPPPDAQGRRPVILSDVSRIYLAKMRDLCRSRGVRLHVLPCPCSDAIPFVDNVCVYEQPIFYEPRKHFYDGIHFFRPFVDAVRRKMIATYALRDAAPIEVSTRGGLKR